MSYKGMNHLELQEIMGNGIRKLIDTSLSPEDREIALENNRAITAMATQMINNGRFILDAEKLQASIGILTHSKANDIIGE